MSHFETSETFGGVWSSLAASKAFRFFQVSLRDKIKA
jgi:hypothetical protein